MFEIADWYLLLSIPIAALAFLGYLRFSPEILLDRPNTRSSHTIARPRGGGLIFGSLWLLLCSAGIINGLPLFFFSALTAAETDPGLPFWFLIGAGIIWINGVLDDLFQFPVWFRISLQAMGVAAGILCPEYFRQSLHPALLLFAWIALIYFINAFNFMDGTDGLAATEAIFIIVVSVLSGFGGLAFELLAILLGVFLIWNLPGARIFMGDAGSNLLGYVVGFLLLKIFLVNPIIAFLLPVLFTVDTTVTLFVRVIRGKPFYLAHREHAYQHIAATLGHSGLLGIAFILNIMVIIPGVYFVCNSTSYTSMAWVILTHLGLGAGVYRVGAGRAKTDF